MHAFDRWPELQLPRVDLGAWPTPVRVVALDGLPLWVKDEGRCAPVYGGNKVRKLELILADALQRGRTDLITGGGVASHHVLATALHGQTLGLRTHAVLFPQAATPHARAVAPAVVEACASVELATSIVAVPAALGRLYLRLLQQTGRKPHRVAPGGSSALGTVGWVAAGLELADDVAAGRTPRPDRIYVALGSGGTVAGLWAGLRLGGLTTEVVGVRVAPRELANRANVRRLAKGALHLLRRHGAPIARPALDGLHIEHRYLGGGYGVPTPEGQAVMPQAAEAGLKVEPTYTAKALAAALDGVRALGGVNLFVQTVSEVGLPEAAGLPEGWEGWLG